MEKAIVNLGCGKTRIPGSIGVDRIKIENYVDVVHDLDVVPYPFNSSSVDEIHFYHVLEHLHDPVRKLEELFRILKPGGVLYMRVPHFSSMGAFTDLTHIRPFGYSSFDCFESNNYYHFYTSANFKILKKEIKYFGQYPNEGVYEKYIHNNQCFWLAKPFVRIINFLIKLSPTFFERTWCYWVGGAGEVVIVLKK
jgi:SAM-dependent methyltransferase